MRDMDRGGVLAPIVPRTMTGHSSSPENRCAVDWSPGGWLAYGVNNLVNVIDPESLRSIQVLDSHQSPVTHVSWARAHFMTERTRHSVTLASGDSTGHLLIWDVNAGEVKALLQEGSRSLTDIRWLDGAIENTGHYIASLHRPYSLVLWDTENGTQVWRFSGLKGELLKSFDFDPFNPFRAVFLSSNSLHFIQDFNVSKPPSPSSASASSYSLQGESQSQKFDSRLRKFVQDIVSSQDYVPDGGSECFAAIFHRFLPQHIFLIYPKEVLLIDLDLRQPVGTFTDRGLSFIQSFYPCQTTDAFYFIHDGGVVSLRTRKAGEYYAAAGNEGGAVAYEHRASGETVRFHKGAKVLGLAVNPNNERSCAVITSDGRVLVSQVQDYSDNIISSDKGSLADVGPGRNLKINTIGVYTGLSGPPLIIRMCPALTLKNMPEYRPIMAGASVIQGTGTIQIYELSTGEIEKEFAVHTFPVKGMEWTGMHTILSYAYQNSVGEMSGLFVRNELVLTDVRTGQTRQIRTNRPEESPISMLRVSYLKQYFILVFANGSVELWDLKSTVHLTTMSRKFPPITALEWSPVTNLKSLRKKLATEKTEGEEKDLMARENFIFTDPEGQLYNFIVECNAIRHVSKFPPESGIGLVTCITWKSSYIVRGDSEGNLNMMDARRQFSKTYATNRGLIKKIRFAPGKGNTKVFVLHFDCVTLWDLSNNEFDLIDELKSPRDIVKILDIEWATSDRPVVSTADGCLKILSENLQSSYSSVEKYGINVFSPCLFSSHKERANFKIYLHHQPWKTTFSFDDAVTNASKKQFDIMDEEFKEGLLNCESQLERSWFASNQSSICLEESAWERDFWKVAYSVLKKNKVKLDINYDVLSQEFIGYSHRRLKFHLSKSVDPDQRQRTINALLCLDKSEDIVMSLLETGPQDTSYYNHNLKACLVVSLKESLSTSAYSTVKVVATNLISGGLLWEGVYILCLIGKILDACTYLQSYNEWEASLWLGKSRLDEEEFKKVAFKYCEHCLNVHRRRRALLIYLGLKEFVRVLDVLYSAKMIPLAAEFLQVLEESGELPDSSHALVLTEDISLAYARYLFDINNVSGAYYYCDKADEKGEILKKEFDNLLAKKD